MASGGDGEWKIWVAAHSCVGDNSEDEDEEKDKNLLFCWTSFLRLLNE